MGGEGTADGLVGGEGLRRAARGAQGTQVEGVQGLVEGVLGDELGQRGERVLGPAEGYGGGQPVAPGPGAAPFGPEGEGVGVAVGEVGERGAPPQAQGLVEELGRPPRAASVQLAGGGVRVPLEEEVVDLLGCLDDEPVAAGIRGDRVGPEGTPQAPDEGLEGGQAVVDLAPALPQTCAISASVRTARPPAAARAVRRARSRAPFRTASRPSVRRAWPGPRMR